MTREERVAALRAELRTAAARFCAACAELEPLAAELADVEGRLRAAEHQVGVYHDPRPTARELAAEALHGRVRALRPYVPFSTEESARRAEEALQGPRTLPAECREGSGECPIGGLCDPLCGLTRSELRSPPPRPSP